MSRFDLIFVDFYGTVSSGDREAVESVCTRVVQDFELPLSPPTFAVRWGEHFFAALDASNGPNFRTLHECVCLSLTQAVGDFDLRIDAPAYVEELERYWANPPIYSDALEFLRRVPLPTCCVSNADTEPLLVAIERHKLRFTCVMTSEMARSYKPHAEIFRHAARAVSGASSAVCDYGKLPGEPCGFSPRGPAQSGAMAKLAEGERRHAPSEKPGAGAMAKLAEGERRHALPPELDALHLLTSDPKRILHVGDSLHADVGGAAPLGLTTVWLCRDSRTHDIGRARADHMIRSLDELLDLVA
ncbi:MAG: HAD family hydrolase [Phycisphaerae bacterium]|nr:HAD family hydrolase [Phycisphaerae bacterium]